ncbi:DUF898 family protein [Microbacter margulisiae]|uniref:DUF898 family protein n=1 Tax=Microbacter margulisiae TaxID=1350067 RepID=A0A7W5H1H8_9PORP|nr:DUF898 family protein [Microbacter margulisiae]MBB3186381.1 hypothetical protein [Microbacter margulisiae]
MKNYLSFQLTGKQFFPLWALFYVLFIVPYVLLISQMRTFNHATECPLHHHLWALLWIILLIVIAFILAFYILKLIVRHIGFKDNLVQCDYKFSGYLKVIIPGLIFSVITLGIYSPWFIRNMHRFFINNASYKDKKFSFHGQATDLLLIYIFAVIIPIFVVTLIGISLFGLHMRHLIPVSRIIYQIVMYIILIPYIYLYYRWRVNIKYEEYHITWHTKWLPSMAKIALEMILSIITCGIYAPLAYLRVYRYFLMRTQSNKVENDYLQFGYDIQNGYDFLYLWGQILLTIVTAGIYYPWAFCKIMRRVLGKTYMEKIAE